MRGLLRRSTDLPAPKLPGWLTRAMASFGGAGLFVIAFFDSSVLSFPFVTDLFVIEFSIHRSALMLFYAAMATLGSLAGSIWLYLLGKKGGEAYYRRREHQEPGRIRLWVSGHAFLSVFVPALFPPPIPYKAFVIAEGVFQVPLRTFIWGVLAGRGLRYFAEGALAVRYGAATETFLFAHKLLLIAIPAGLTVLSLVFSHFLFLSSKEPAAAKK